MQILKPERPLRLRQPCIELPFQINLEENYMLANSRLGDWLDIYNSYVVKLDHKQYDL